MLPTLGIVLRSFAITRLTIWAVYRFGTDIELSMLSMIHGGKYNRIAMPYTDHLGSSFKIVIIPTSKHLIISIIFHSPGLLPTRWPPMTSGHAWWCTSSQSFGEILQVEKPWVDECSTGFRNWYFGTFSTSECLHAYQTCGISGVCASQMAQSSLSLYKATACFCRIKLRSMQNYT